MRKVSSHILFMIMLLVSIQPTLAMHFCGDSLHAISLPQPALEHHSCNMQCADNQAESHSSFNNIPCCSIENVQVKTDTYQASETHPDLNLQRYIVMELIPLYLNYIYEPMLWDDSSLQILHKFPPRGLGQYTSDLLKNICIYRL